MVSAKKQHGQFFTTANPFVLEPFREWFDLLPNAPKLLEPFAGANNLVKMIDDIYGRHHWESFDIDPPLRNAAPRVPIVRKDTLADMPEGFDAIITNPPYLARNSATRSGILFAKENHHDDLYKFCLEKMLAKYDFVAAIIPESFITSGQFREKLFSVISLTQNMFDDTDCPVCIAMFTPLNIKLKKMCVDDFMIYRLDDSVGSFSKLKQYLPATKIGILPKIKCHFNDKEGKIGLRGVDNTLTESIRFVRGDTIDPQKIKHTSRAVTRITIDGISSQREIDEIIDRSNALLNEYRKNTDDIFMTSFKGLRKDGRYRRRLDYKTAEDILNLAMTS